MGWKPKDQGNGILLFDQHRLVEYFARDRLDVQLVISGRQGVEVIERYAVDSIVHACTDHADDLARTEVGQENDAVHWFFAGDFQKNKIIKRVRENRNLSSQDHW